MSAWVERMGPMYHEGAYFDDAVTVSFLYHEGAYFDDAVTVSFFNPLDT